MWLTIALGYCVVCWLIGFLVTRSASWMEACSTAECSAAGPSRTQVALIEGGAVLFAPLYMPLLAILAGKCVLSAIREHRLLVRASRTFRAYEFVKVNVLHLDEAVRGQFELHTPAFLRLNFDLIGDYRLKPEPIEVHDRLFLSPDGETLGSICALLNEGSVCFMSVLDDGTCVDTCSAEDPDPGSTVEPADRLWVTFVAGAPTEDLYAHHLKTLQELCARTGAGVMRFQKEQFRDVVTYDQRTFCRWRFRHGDMDHEPPAPDFSSLRAAPAVFSDSPEHITAASS